MGAIRRLAKAMGKVALLLLRAGLWLAVRTDELSDVDGRVAYLLHRLAADDAAAQMVAPGSDGRYRGEWYLVSLSMTAAAVTNQAFAHPERRAAAAAAVAALVERALGPDASAFDTEAWGEPLLAHLDGDKGHAGYLGHLYFMLAAEALLTPEAPHAALRARLRDAAARRMAAAPGGFLETYSGQRYVADCAVVAAALGLDDLASGTDHGALLRAWSAHAQQRLRDPASGLLVFGVTAEGGPRGLGRGSSTGWNGLYLPAIDPALAQDQFRRLRDRLVQPHLGLVGVREFLPGRGGWGDVDSGPLIWGWSPSATGFALAGARREGDDALASDLLRTAEVAGITVSTAAGRRYLLAPLVGDAIVAAMRTARPWDRRFLDAPRG
jgi:hypothetical protein